MGLSDKLKKLREQAKAATEPVVETKKEEEPKEETKQEVPPAQKPEMTLLEKLRASKASSGAPEEEKKEDQNPEIGAEVKEKLKELGQKKEINPPEGEIQEDFLPEEPQKEEPPKEEKKGETCPTCGKTFKVLAKHRCKLAQQDPPKEDAPALTEEISKEEEEAKEDLPKEEPKEEIKEEQKRTVQDFTLLIDCVPSDAKIGGFSIIHASRLCMPVKEAINKEHNVEHYKLIQYGAGPGLLKARFERMLQQGIDADFVYLDSRDLDSPSITDVLCNYARLVLRAVR